MVLSGLTPDRHGGEGFEACQSVVFLLGEVIGLGVIGDSRKEAAPWELLAFRDGVGSIVHLAGLVWQNWLAGTPRPSWVSTSWS